MIKGEATFDVITSNNRIHCHPGGWINKIGNFTFLPLTGLYIFTENFNLKITVGTTRSNAIRQFLMACHSFQLFFEKTAFH